ILGMTAGSFALATAAHKDVLTIQIGVINQALELHLIVKELALEKGIFIRSPYIPFPDTVEFASKQSYLGTLFGKQRPLNVIEMTHIFNNIQTNFIGKSLMLGFAQVTQDPELKAYYLRGKNIAQKHITLFSTILENEDIPGPRFWDTIVTAETAAPFSDKLMLFHASAMSAAGIANYGASMAASPRRDIGLKYSRILVEVSLYAEDGANLMIDNGWLEEPPQSPDREHLIKKK
ncbi:DUF3231 family protein, partial [Fictibacillus sp. NRS-1165]|uniref:DUF3231 family protein n=1 Tax=Fictibacillus sp. NRS-1165 TaxID=3144463 RepID=UPI003D1A82B2